VLLGPVVVVAQPGHDLVGAVRDVLADGAEVAEQRVGEHPRQPDPDEQDAEHAAGHREATRHTAARRQLDQRQQLRCHQRRDDQGHGRRPRIPDRAPDQEHTGGDQ
jgi:hypothetical protein